MAAEWIVYKGKKIFSINLKGLKAPEILKVQEDAAKLLGQSPAKALILMNSEGAMMNSQTMQRAQALGRDIIEPRTERFAIVGVTGFLMVFMQTYNRFTGAGSKQRLFNTEAEAKEWLVS